MFCIQPWIVEFSRPFVVGEGRLRAVSYTHLDVYKRQGTPHCQQYYEDLLTNRTVKSRRRDHVVYFLISTLTKVYDKIIPCPAEGPKTLKVLLKEITSVSYTHLDVYKRQGTPCLLGRYSYFHKNAKITTLENKIYN